MSPAPTSTGSAAGGGGPATTVNVLALLAPRCPAASACSARAVYVPSPSPGLASTAYAPLAPRFAASVCTGGLEVSEPACTFTVTVVESPPTVPATPLKDGVVSVVELPWAGVVSVTTGATGPI